MTHLRRHRVVIFSMSQKVPCYLRTLSRKWGLTQAEVASLLPRGNRNRVSRVELDKVPPNAQEIVAYRLIFGAPTKAAFPRFVDETEDAVMRGAYQLHRRLERDKSARADKIRRLLDQMLARATGKVKPRKV